MQNDDRTFMALAIEKARKSKPEDARAHPLVGAVAVKDGRVLAAAHRGEIASGNHAEFTLLESKLRDESLVGATIYTTLEPCTSRNHPKVPCALRLTERKVHRVVIGMLDPNPAITGKGQLALREANIVTDLFPSDLMAEVEAMNREFIRSQKGHGSVTAQRSGSSNLIKRLSKRLITDFSPYGDHAGEFGRTASAVEQGRWAAGGPDRVDVKPWYYLTYWAVRGLFLSDPDSLTDFSTTIIQNVERRRTGKRWLQVLVDRSAAYDTMPGESEQIVVKSYRHTIRGANIVTILDPESRIAWQVLTDIVDSESTIQNKDGGWPQADKVYTSSDLWTTAYVLRFISDFRARHKLESTTRHGVTEEQIQMVRQKTLAYVTDEWAKTNWVYREMPSKAVVPKFLVEIAGLTDWSASPITQAVVDHCLAQLTLGGRIRNERDIEQNDISELQQLIRIGFALQQMNASASLGLDTIVQQIRDNVLSMVNDSDRLGPEDVAFCIHLVMEGTP